MWRVSVGVLELLVGLRPFDHVHEVECMGGSFDFRDALVLQFGTAVGQDVARLSRDQKPCACTWVSVVSAANWAVSMDWW